MGIFQKYAEPVLGTAASLSWMLSHNYLIAASCQIPKTISDRYLFPFSMWRGFETFSLSSEHSLNRLWSNIKKLLLDIYPSLLKYVSDRKGNQMSKEKAGLEMYRKIGINRNFEGLELLKRVRLEKIGIPPSKQIFKKSSFLPSLSIYYNVLKLSKTIESQVAVHIIGHVNDILENFFENRIFTENQEVMEYVDDISRKVLKVVDDWGFGLLTKTKFKDVGLLLNGIATSGGPTGWYKDVLIENCESWVTGEKRWAANYKGYVQKKLEKWCYQWVNEHAEVKKQKMNFTQYCSDPMKWATGGGAKKKTMPWTSTPDDVFRTKWAWAISTIATHGCDEVYSQALKEPNVAAVALKEETKTRLVITTPMASYLRQSYILYRMGTPTFLNSTLVSPLILNEFASSVGYNYVCIDASRFDQNFPKWAVIMFLRIIERSLPSGEEYLELKSLINEEIESLSSLRVSIMGREFEYQSGLLSGWRLTSILGSIASAILCEFINESMQLGMHYITQGDDIFMINVNPVDVEMLMDVCDRFGVDTHPDKCMFGSVGEFLKFVYTREKIVALPSRTLRSICYINPWLDKTAERTPSDVAGGWMNLLSRLNMVSPDEKMSREICKYMFRDIHGWASNKMIVNNKDERVHLNIEDIRRLIATPRLLGGLGCWETSGYVNRTLSRVTYSEMTEIRDRHKTADQQFFEMFGVQTTSGTFKKQRLYNTTPYNIGSMTRRLPNRVLDKKPNAHFWLDETEGFFATMVEMVRMVRSFPTVELLAKRFRQSRFTKICSALLDKNNWPTRIRYRPRWQDVASWAMGVTQLSLPTSLFVDTRYDAGSLRSMLAEVENWFTCPTHMRKGDLWIATVHIHRELARTSCWLHSL